MNRQEILIMVYDYLRSIGVVHTKKELAEKIGFEQTNLSSAFSGSHKYLTDGLFERIDTAFPNIFNKNWLLTGEGEMLMDKEADLPEKYPIDSEVGVPFYDINVTASITESFNDIKEKPSYKINVPFLNDCTAAFPVYGDSMLPAYRPGDTVIVKQINNRESLLWGEVYLVITNANCDNMRTIKRVYISDDRQNYILRATNPEFAGDTIVPCDDVIGLFLVKGKISRTQL